MRRTVKQCDLATVPSSSFHFMYPLSSEPLSFVLNGRFKGNSYILHLRVIYYVVRDIIHSVGDFFLLLLLLLMYLYSLLLLFQPAEEKVNCQTSPLFLNIANQILRLLLRHNYIIRVNNHRRKSCSVCLPHLPLGCVHVAKKLGKIFLTWLQSSRQEKERGRKEIKQEQIRSLM